MCSHLGPLALFCTADTLLIASCLFWLENWLLAYFLPPPFPIVSFASESPDYTSARTFQDRVKAGPVKSFKSNRGANSMFDQTQKVVSRLYKNYLSTFHTSKQQFVYSQYFRVNKDTTKVVSKLSNSSFENKYNYY